MSRARVLYHMMRADFLERVRRYSFLLTLGLSVYLGYAVYAGQISVQMGDYHGVNNSAWVGSVVGLVASVWITLVGFYVVKNAIQRDRETRVGQILASTPISKGFYTVGKTLSNFAVLALMVCILALAAVLIQLLDATHPRIDLVALLAPILLFGLTAVAVTAAFAVLFESLPVLRGGVGNVVYFFLWTMLISISAMGVEHRTNASNQILLNDYTGLATVMGQMQEQVRLVDPQYGGGSSFTVGNLHPATKLFVWSGIHWTSAILISRAMMLVFAVALALLAAVFFDRFDPARGMWLRGKKASPAPAPNGAEAEAQDTPARISQGAAAVLTAAQLPGLAQGASRPRLLALVVAECRLMLRGQPWWWYVAAAGLFIGSLFSPVEAGRMGVNPVACLWPILLWSQMGTREARFSTGSLIFSAPHAVARQLFAMYVAGVATAALTGGGLGLHLLFAGDKAGMAAWGAAAVFIPALALALGVTTGSRKAFEALYTGWWYIGPLHHIRTLDFMGTTPESSTPGGYALAAVVLVLVAYLWRRVQRARA